MNQTQKEFLPEMIYVRDNVPPPQYLEGCNYLMGEINGARRIVEEVLHVKSSSFSMVHTAPYATNVNISSGVHFGSVDKLNYWRSRYPRLNNEYSAEKDGKPPHNDRVFLGLSFDIKDKTLRKITSIEMDCLEILLRQIQFKRCTLK